MPNASLSPSLLWLDKHGVILIYLEDTNRILELNGWAAEHFRKIAVEAPVETSQNEEIAQLENQLRDLGVFV
jgi:hypothetical protein